MWTYILFRLYSKSSHRYDHHLLSELFVEFNSFPSLCEQNLSFSGLAKHTIVNVDLLSQNVALMQLLHIRKIDIVQNKQCAICNVQPSITTCAHCSRHACVTCLETHRQEVIGEITRETMEIERMSEELKMTLNQTSNDFRDQCDETFQQTNKRLGIVSLYTKDS